MHMKHIAYILLLLLTAVLPAHARHTGRLRVALVQAHLKWGSTDGNLHAFAQRIDRCKGCDLIVFPELFTSGCDMKPKDKEKAVRMKDEVAARYHEITDSMTVWARRSGALVIGSTIYKEGGKYYNRLIAARPDGSFLCYDKHNCFKRGSFAPGDEHLILTWKSVRLATYICYDLRFPEWSRNNGRYDAAVYIANWPQSRSDDWNRLLAERARENRAYVIAVNCAGTDPNGITYKGESCILAPDGHALARCNDLEDEILIKELCLE